MAYKVHLLFNFIYKFLKLIKNIIIILYFINYNFNSTFDLNKMKF